MFKNFLTSGFTFTEEQHELKLKYKLFNSLLAFNVVVVFIASLARLNEGNIIQFSIDITYSTLGLIIIILARKYQRLFQLFVKIVMIVSYIIVSLSFYVETNSIVGISWFIILLIVVMFLTDKKFTFITLGFSILAIASIAYINQEKGYTILSTVYGSIPLFVSYIFLIFYEKRNQENQQILQKQNQRLFDLTNNLQELVDIEVEKNKKQSELLARQAQSAALGEMMDAIAHQWKQPLSVISIQVESLALLQEYGNGITTADINNTQEKVSSQVSHLINTIDEFRSFFRPNQKLVSANIYEIVNSTLLLMKDSLIQNSIKVEVSGDKDIEIHCIPNEFKHIFINLINNSKDAFIENKIENRKINFHLEKQNNTNEIKISDNAGGIPEDIITDIFSSNFTTKSETTGTGIGLYLSKQIIDKLNGTLKAENIDNGVCFTITVQ